MLKRTLNELVISLTISPNGPVLVKASTAGLGTDMRFVKVVRNGRTEVYLPGSSLKGVLRSHCEKICRTLQPFSVCAPFNVRKEEANHPHVSCSQILRSEQWKNKDSATHYKALCPACRLFGSLNFKGRCFVDDAYAVGDPPQPYVRDGVGIDRFTGAAARSAKYDFEVITAGTFATQIHLINFEMWQLELLLFAVRDLTDGRIRIGMGTSRGLGNITVAVTAAELSVFGRKPTAMHVEGLATLAGSEADHYGLLKLDKDTIDLVNLVSEPWTTIGIRHVCRINPDKLVTELPAQLAGVLATYLDRNPQRAFIHKK